LECINQMISEMNLPEGDRQLIQDRMARHAGRLREIYFHLYANQDETHEYFTDLLRLILQSWIDREPYLKEKDEQVVRFPNWFYSNNLVGGVCYVDLFAETLNGIEERIPYFQELGINYVHLMPFFKVSQGDNDGGYAVSSYREVDERLGTMDDLRRMSRQFHENRIALVADFVFNHTSDEHDWARQAKLGNPKYTDFYYIFDDRAVPDMYEKTLREIFPTERPGSFTYKKEIDKWVWTTFHSYQWDLNYANPKVFNAMVGEMLFLANCGIDVLRLDAVAFIWKEMGTPCENLPEAHMIIQAFNLACRIAAPALYFKSEAIVHPDEVIKYIDPAECQLSYNPLLMALLWTCLASKEIRLLRLSMEKRFAIPEGTSWVNYLRCHDDIGWTFSDEDAEQLNIHGFFHRKWLNEFYSGEFPGSFAKGMLFQENKKTGDARISGQAASLAGLEKALEEKDDHKIDLSIKRILMMYTIIMTIGGIPLIYLGDEVGTINQYQFLDDPHKASDSRWMHRPAADWKKIQKRQNQETTEGKIFSGFQAIIRIRKEHLVFGGNKMKVMDVGNDHIFAYLRENCGYFCWCFSNFDQEAHTISPPPFGNSGSNVQVDDLLTGKSYSPGNDMLMEPYQTLLLAWK